MLLQKRLEGGEAFVAYCHPYEFDCDEFWHLNFYVSLKTRMHQGVGRRGFEAKFKKIVQEFKPDLALHLAEQAQWPLYTPL